MRDLEEVAFGIVYICVDNHARDGDRVFDLDTTLPQFSRGLDAIIHIEDGDGATTHGWRGIAPQVDGEGGLARFTKFAPARFFDVKQDRQAKRVVIERFGLYPIGDGDGNSVQSF